MYKGLVAVALVVAALITAVSAPAQQISPHNLSPTYKILATDVQVQPGAIAFRATEPQMVPPGKGYAILYWTSGSNPGTCKLVALAGTSITPVVVADNVGSGGCQ